MKPMPLRTVSAIVIRNFLSEGGDILMDCGEGTFSQMILEVGIDQAEKFIINLELIIISHIHLDHNSNLLTILH